MEYIKPSMDFYEFAVDDIISASGETPMSLEEEVESSLNVT